MISIRNTLYWTKHSQAKMHFYGISENKAKRILRNPKRVEEGVAPKTIAMMQRAGSKKHPYEIWVMIQKIKAKTKIISVWRYPGITKPREIPEGLLEELQNAIKMI